MSKSRPFRRSLSDAIRGLIIAARNERHIQVHLIAMPLVLIAAGLLNVSSTDWAILLLTIGLVIVTELVNTALEQTHDRISTEHNELTRNAKDIAAAAVLWASLIAISVGVVILGPPILDLWRG